MKKILTAVVVLALFGAGMFAALPFLTLLRIKSAVEAQDGKRLSKEIDMPVLRENLKEQLKGPAGQWVRKRTSNPLEEFVGRIFTSFAVDELVDHMVTPEGLSELMKGRAPRGGNEGGGPSEKDDSSKSFRWKNLSTFEVTATAKNGKPVTLVLSRTGLSWKLTNIILPIE